MDINVEDRVDSQNAQILAALRAGRALTPLDALAEFGCFRLGARVFDLKEEGHPIQSQFVTTSNGKRVKEYWMEAQ